MQLSRSFCFSMVLRFSPHSGVTLDFMRSAATKLVLVILFLGVLAGFIVQTTSDLWLTVWFILFIFAGVPLLILAWVDLGRALRISPDVPRLFFVPAVIFGIPQALFGMLAFVSGISIIAWVLYNSLVERQAEYSGGFLTFGFAPVIAIVGWFWLREALAKARQSQEEAGGPDNPPQRTGDE